MTEAAVADLGEDWLDEAAIDAIEAARYPDPDTYQSMYYPKYLTGMYLNSKQLQNIVECSSEYNPDVAASLLVCHVCKKPLDHNPRRVFVNEALTCVACCRLLGVASSRGFLPFDIVVLIVSFFPEYVHVARAARVCKTWFRVVNMDKWRETSMMGFKRYWLAREFYLNKQFANQGAGIDKNARKKKSHRLTEFRALLDYVQLITEWKEREAELLKYIKGGPYVPTLLAGESFRRAQLRILLRILLSPYMLQSLNITKLKRHAVNAENYEAVLLAIWSGAKISADNSKQLKVEHEEIVVEFDGDTRKGVARYISAGVILEIDGRILDVGLSFTTTSETRCKCCVM
jgi:hypothetical protein